MREASDLGIGAGVRRELAGRRVDLSKIKFPVMAGVVTLEGELSFVGLEKTVDETAVELKFMESSIRRIAGVKDIVFALANWAKSEVGVWESTVESGGAGFAIDGEGITCGGCNYVIRFCPCCGKPLGEAKHGGSAGSKTVKRVVPPIKPVVKRRVPVMPGLGEKPVVEARPVAELKPAVEIKPAVEMKPAVELSPSVAPVMPEMPVVEEPVVPAVEKPAVPEVPVIPAMPVAPAMPVVPAMPTTEKPAVPAMPVVPVAPVVPAAPVTPVAPVMPAMPVVESPAMPTMPVSPVAPVMPVVPVMAEEPKIIDTPAEPETTDDPFAGFSLSGLVDKAPEPAPKLDSDPFANFNIADFTQSQETPAPPPASADSSIKEPSSSGSGLDFSDLSNDFLKNPFGSDGESDAPKAKAQAKPAIPNFNLADDLLASIGSAAPAALPPEIPPMAPAMASPLVEPPVEMPVEAPPPTVAQEPAPKGKPSMKIPDFNFDELLSGSGGLEDSASEDQDGLMVFDLGEEDDTPLPPMKPAAGTGSAPGASSGKIDLNKEANDIFSSLLSDPKKPKKNAGSSSDGLFGNIDFDADLEIISTGDDDFGGSTNQPSQPSSGTKDPFDVTNVIDLDADLPPTKGSKKDPFNLDDFDLNKLGI